jgi:hypothetical protein
MAICSEYQNYFELYLWLILSNTFLLAKKCHLFKKIESILSLFDLLFWSYDQFVNQKIKSFDFLQFDLLTFTHKMYLRVVFKDDRDVHVDDDEKADDEVGEEKGDSHGGIATVSGFSRLVVVLGAVLLVDDPVQNAVPSGAC